MAKILIAEDEPDIQTLIAITLRHAGHTVVAVGDGLAACEQAVAVLPDLIVLDVMMPKLNGYKACQRLRAEPQLQNVPVIFLSVRGMEQEIQEGFAAGAVEYLVKPFSPLELNQRVASVLQKIPPISDSNSKP
jgi:DNA-binding response OmpR family regulator